MENFVLDLESGELLTVTSSDFAMDSEGRVVRRTSDRSAINVDDGTFRLIDYWPKTTKTTFESVCLIAKSLARRQPLLTGKNRHIQLQVSFIYFLEFANKKKTV